MGCLFSTVTSIRQPASVSAEPAGSPDGRSLTPLRSYVPFVVPHVAKIANSCRIGFPCCKLRIAPFQNNSKGFLALALNLVAYHTFLLVTQHDIKYRRWRSSVVQPISALQEIRTHNTDGWGSATGKRQVDLVFKDGTVVDFCCRTGIGVPGCCGNPPSPGGSPSSPH